MTTDRHLAAAVACGLLAAGLLALGMAFATAAGRPSPEGLAGSALFASAACAAAACGGALLARRPLGEALGLRAPVTSASRIGLYALGLTGLSCCIGFALELAGLREDSTLGFIDEIVDGASAGQLALLLAGAAAAPAVGEELLFRGAILGSASRALGLVRGAALSTLLFALVHVDPVHVVAACALGAWLAAVRIASRSTLAAIACHACNNGAALWLSSGAGPPAALLVPAAALAAVAAAPRLIADLRSDPSGPDGGGTARDHRSFP